MRLTPALLLVAGCATVAPRAGFDTVKNAVPDHHVYWEQGGPEDAQVSALIHSLAAAPLSVDSAIELALLGNRELQATFEELGIAQADLVQAGLLRNPVLGGSLRFPIQNGVLDVGFSVAQELIGLVALPMRKRIAAAAFDATRLHVADAVIGLASQTRRAFLEVQANRQLEQLCRTIWEAAETSSELATRQHDAGNLSDLAYATLLGQHEQARIDLDRSTLAVSLAREKLTSLMGFADDTWRVEALLPEVPTKESSLDGLEDLAVRRRLDLQALAKRTQAAEAALNGARALRWIGSTELGVSGERDVEGHFVLGPTVSLELPIFDQHQASIAKLAAEARQANKRLSALTVDVRSEVRSIRARLQSARQIVEHYRMVLLPLREKIVTLSQQQYNSMLLGTYQLIQAQQAETNAYREYVEAVRDYWIARADLERATGGPLEVKR